MLLHKNAKYLLYKFNDSTESINAEKGLIRHTSKVKNEVGLQKIEEIFLAVFDRKNYNRKRYFLQNI